VRHRFSVDNFSILIGVTVSAWTTFLGAYRHRFSVDILFNPLKFNKARSLDARCR
jgi:hypothetical protein